MSAEDNKKKPSNTFVVMSCLRLQWGSQGRMMQIPGLELIEIGGEKRTSARQHVMLLYTLPSHVYASLVLTAVLIFLLPI